MIEKTIDSDLTSLYHYKIASVSETTMPIPKSTYLEKLNTELDDQVYNLEGALKKISAPYRAFLVRQEKVPKTIIIFRSLT